MRFILPALAVGLCMCASAPAADQNKECTDAQQTALARWLACHDIKVRKAFDGAEAEQQPASVNFESAEGEADFYSVDLGVRFPRYEMSTKSASHFIYPTVEAHRSTSSDEQINKKSVALRYEFFPQVGDVRAPLLPGVLPPPPSKATTKPWFVTDVEAVRDSQAHKSFISSSALATLRSAGGGWRPGQPIRCVKDGPVCARWQPYIGLEYFNDLPVGPEDVRTFYSGSFSLARLNAEFRPFRTFEHAPFELIGTLEYRDRLSSSSRAPASATSWSIEANYYLDAAATVALGLTYSQGRNPTNNFVEEDKYSLALKFKFTDLPQ
jgi:hypothetical protein